MDTQSTAKVILITGASRRIGAEIARTLHRSGHRIIVHYHASSAAAEKLCDELNAIRPTSAQCLCGNLLETTSLPELVAKAQALWQRLDVLINNASTFYPTPVGHTEESHWNDLFGTNLKAPYFLAQATLPYLKEHAGCIVNITDVHAERPMKDYPVYSMAKSGLLMMTRALARELAPEIRVNAVAPGAIIWPENDMTDSTQAQILSRIALRRQGQPQDIARTVRFLIDDAPYITGQVINVDGGRSIQQ